MNFCHVSSLLFLICLQIAANSARKAAITLLDQIDLPCKPTCFRWAKCNPFYMEEPIYTLVDGNCKIFTNGCVRGTFDCGRVNSCLPASVIISKEECHKLCTSRNCETSKKSPVCGYFYNNDVKEEKQTFANLCELDRYSCLNSKPYGYYNEGEC